MRNVTVKHPKRPLPTHVFSFESMSELVRFVRPDGFQPRSKAFVGEDLPSWDAVVKRTTRDWAEGMYILKQFLDRLLEAPLPELKSKKRQIGFDALEGDELDLDRLYSGNDPWRKVERLDKVGATEVTILIEASAHAGVKPIDILWRGAAGLAMAQLLEQRGYRAEIWCLDAGYLYAYSRAPVMLACNLKRTSDPLDTSTLINTVSGWFYRTVTFALMESVCKFANQPVAGGYGTVYVPTPLDLDALSRDENRMFVSQVYSFDGALGCVREGLRKLLEKGEK